MTKTKHIAHESNIDVGPRQVAEVSVPKHEKSPDLVNTILFSNVINDLIVIAFLIWIFRRFNLIGFIVKKRDEIAEKIHNVEEEKNIKENQLQKTKDKVKNVNQEVNRMIDEGDQVANSVSERIIEDAEVQAATMQKKAHGLVENESKAAENKVMNEVTSASFAVADQIIRESIDDRLHQKYIDEFIDNIESYKV